MSDRPNLPPAKWPMPPMSSGILHSEVNKDRTAAEDKPASR